MKIKCLDCGKVYDDEKITDPLRCPLCESATDDIEVFENRYEFYDSQNARNRINRKGQEVKIVGHTL